VDKDPQSGEIILFLFFPMQQLLFSKKRFSERENITIIGIFEKDQSMH
jgi:hypothetical protein